MRKLRLRQGKVSHRSCWRTEPGKPREPDSLEGGLVAGGRAGPLPWAEQKGEVCSGCARGSGWVESCGRGAPLVSCAGATALRTPLFPGRSHLDKLAAQVGPWAGGSVRDCLGLGWGLSWSPGRTTGWGGRNTGLGEPTGVAGWATSDSLASTSSCACGAARTPMPQAAVTMAMTGSETCVPQSGCSHPGSRWRVLETEAPGGSELGVRGQGMEVLTVRTLGYILELLDGSRGTPLAQVCLPLGLWPPGLIGKASCLRRPQDRGVLGWGQIPILSPAPALWEITEEEPGVRRCGFHLHLLPHHWSRKPPPFPAPSRTPTSEGAWGVDAAEPGEDKAWSFFLSSLGSSSPPLPP